MAEWGRNPLLVAIPLWMCFGRADSKNVATTLQFLSKDKLTVLVVTCAALTEPEICYVLDGILFLYGIILTALYCRIKILNAKEASARKGKNDESIYTGLSPRVQDTYETIGMKK